MRNRWGILAVLFTVRLVMAFQFQSVPSVAPLLQTQFGVGLAEICGDDLDLHPLALMLAGSCAMAFGGSWSWQVAGRLMAGTGGVLLNVQMTKMVADWFTGKEIATAMAIFVNSWPAGVALSLVTLPSIATGYGLNAVHLFVAALTAAGIVLTFAYQPPPNAAAAATSSARLDFKTLMAVMVAEHDGHLVAAAGQIGRASFRERV